MASIFNPYQYQEDAISWIIDHPRCALFLDMGLGKTVSTLTAIRRLMDWCEVSKTLVVAPKKVAETTWTSEAAKWQHLCDLRVVRVMGTPRQRTAALETDADIYVIGRDSLKWLVDHYNGILPYDVLVLDELSSFKSPKSLRFKSVKIVTPTFQRVIGLTGTPAPNGLADLWAQIYCLDMGARLGKSVSRYREAYFSDFSPTGGNYHLYKIKAGAETVIQSLISDICLSMQSKDYLTLPDRFDHTVHITLPAAVMREYERFEKDNVLAVRDQLTGGASVILATSALALMNKLSQFSDGAVYDADKQIYDKHTEKLDKLSEIVEAAQSPVLVFYQFKHDAIRIKSSLRDYRVRQYEGEQDLEDWNAGRIDVLLAHPASCAYGLNMQQGGHYIVWFSTGWNLEQYQQANARLHRQGQQHPVHVYHLVCDGTVDERALQALSNKKTVQQNLLDSLDYLKKKYQLTD